MEWLGVFLPVASVEAQNKFPFILVPRLNQGFALFFFLVQWEVLNDDATTFQHLNIQLLAEGRL